MELAPFCVPIREHKNIKSRIRSEARVESEEDHKQGRSLADGGGIDSSVAAWDGVCC